MSGPPPVLPPKPGSHEPSRHGTPSLTQPATATATGSGTATPDTAAPQLVSEMEGSSLSAADPGPHWLPASIQNKSTKDLAAILHSPALIHALTESPSTATPALSAQRRALLTQLSANAGLAQTLTALEARLAGDRAAANAQLLAAKKLERAWAERQREADVALAPFMPAALYQRLGQGVAEQRAVCEALEESFVEGEGVATERETMDWIKRYKEAKMVYWRRKEQKERWDEGRVGGWR